MQEKPCLKIGDDVTLQQLNDAHTRHWVEVCDTLQEAAKHLGISTRTLRRWLDKRIAYTVHPRSLRQLAARGRARLFPSDEAETSTDNY